MARHVRVFGGLIVVLAASAAWAQPPGGGRGFGRGFGGPTSGTMLLAMEEVRDELKTTEEQNAKIETLTSEARTKMQEAFGGFQELQGLDDEERNKRMAEGRQKMEQVGKESDAKLAGILKPE